MDSTDVLIVGAGPAGLALACGLLQQGVPVRVVDQAPGPATTSRANILHARGVEVLGRLGALGELPQRSVSAVKITIHIGGRPLATVRFGEVADAPRSALVCSQAEVEAELRRRLAELGGTVQWGTALAEATDDGGGVTAILADGQAVRATWLAGCDGAHSQVRKLAGITFPGAPVAERFLLADVYADVYADRSGTAGWFHRDGMLLVMPMPGGDDAGQNRWRLIADVPLAEDEEPDEQEVLDHFRRLFPERAGLDDVRIHGARWTSTFRIHRRLAEDYRRGRMLLAGDAAHIHSPIGGQGMNTGIGDAENLAWKLALVLRGRAAESLLDTYRAERRPLATEVLRGSTAATRLLLGHGRLARLLRDRVAVPLVNRPRVQRRLTAAGSQLGVTYRRGPLAASTRGSGRGDPRPGDRVPDQECLRRDGSRTRLHAELGGHWALLVPDGGADACVDEAQESLGEYLLTLTHTDGRTREVLLVRPDGHLAWRGRPGSNDAAGLARWLAGALRHGQVARKR